MHHHFVCSHEGRDQDDLIRMTQLLQVINMPGLTSLIMCNNLLGLTRDL